MRNKLRDKDAILVRAVFVVNKKVILFYGLFTFIFITPRKGGSAEVHEPPF